MPPVLTRKQFDAAERHLLHRGRFGNATVWRLPGDEGPWVIKDFSNCPAVVRWTWGRWLAGHEYRVLRRLQGVPGVPADPFRVDALAFGYRFIVGRSLREIDHGACRRAFFEHLESMVRAMHERCIVHLDLRNARNLIVGGDRCPAMIDFQSAMSTRRWPHRWRRALERVDLSGVYKHWAQHDPDSLGAERTEILRWQLRSRRWWRLRGYQWPGRQRALRHFEIRLLREPDSQAADGKKPTRQQSTPSTENQP